MKLCCYFRIQHLPQRNETETATSVSICRKHILTIVFSNRWISECAWRAKMMVGCQNEFWASAGSSKGNVVLVTEGGVDRQRDLDENRARFCMQHNKRDGYDISTISNQKRSCVMRTYVDNKMQRFLTTFLRKS